MDTDIKVGDLYISEYRVKYKVLAVWNDFVWLSVHYSSDASNPLKPVTQSVSFLSILTLISRGV